MIEATEKKEKIEHDTIKAKENKIMKDLENKMKEEREEKMEYWVSGCFILKHVHGSLFFS